MRVPCPRAVQLALALSLGAPWSARAQPAPAQPVPAGSPSKARKPPPAVLHVPDAVKKQRSAARALDEDPPTVFSVMPPEVMAALGQLTPTPGAWVEYGVRAGTTEESRVRLSVLAPALPAGRYWLELVLASNAAVPLAARLLLKGDPSDPANVERMLIYVAGQAPLELPVDQAQDALEALGKDDEGKKYQPGQRRPGVPPGKVERLGQEVVTVRAGKFTAEKLRVTDLRTKEVTLVWKSAELPVLPLVRAQGRGRTIELLGFGRTGAHSVIDAEPGDAFAPPAAP